MTATGTADTARKVGPRVFKAAAGLAAHLFSFEAGDGTPATTRAHLLYLLDGHITAWSGWAGLPEADRIRVARLLKRRTNDFANAHPTGKLLDRLLAAGEIGGCRPGDGYESGTGGTVLVDSGMSLPAFVDKVLDELDVLFEARSRALRPAPPGHYTTTVRVPCKGADDSYASFRFHLQDAQRDPGLAVPVIVDSPPLESLEVPFVELRAVAEALDGNPAVEGTHRGEVVEKFERSVRSAQGLVTSLDLTAGSLNELLAYTGFGKSVILIEVFACWAISRRLVVTFVLPTNADVVKATHQIETAAVALGKNAEVVALTSPRSRIDVAEAITGRGTAGGPGHDWVWDRFGYGCALAAVATTADGIDSWVPGREPCGTLRDPRPGAPVKTFACPWRTGCGRFRASRAACTADVIVTSHVNLLLGVLQAPVKDGHGITDRLSVEELVLRRCQVVVIDEIDAFQQQAIEHAGRGLILDEARKTTTPLRRLDTDFASAHGALHDEVDANVRDAYFGLRYLSENYVSHLTYQRLGPARHDTGSRRTGPGRAWIVPRRRDSWLMTKLFKTEVEDLTDDQRTAFETLFPDGPVPSGNTPAGFAEARTHLERVVGNGLAGAAIAGARSAVTDLVEHLSSDDRREFADWMLRRTMLERLRGFLHRLMANNSQLVDAGVESAQAVADALGTYGRWRATPTGPLGRLVFAFTEYFDDTGSQPAKLATAAFGGDPHTYTVSVGDLTALAHAGKRRIVLGLSATSYFPLAPRHHLHTKPKWWVPDASTARVTIKAATVADPAGRPERISGVDGPARSAAVRRIAAGLWTTHLAAEFERLAVEEDVERRNVLLATTSYAAAREVAEGLAEAGVNAARICLAVPPRSDLTEGRRWKELQADRLEEFPAQPGADILIAPLARVERGVNIIGAASRSALGSVWLIVRPVPVVDEPAELVAHIQAAALADHPGPSTTPLELLADRRRVAGTFLDKIVRCPPYFQSQPERVKLAVAAEIIIGAIQLIGRARRGGTPAVLHLVDGAFHGDGRGTDFASLITRLRGKWTPEQLRDMTEFYGDTLQAFLDYAAENTR